MTDQSNEIFSGDHTINLARLSRLLVEERSSLALLHRVAKAAAQFDSKPGPTATALVEAIIAAYADIDITVEAHRPCP